MSINLCELIKDIEKYRIKMMILASNSSMSDRKVVEVSKQLDSLIYNYLIITKKQ